jgi:hypothetical protein
MRWSLVLALALLAACNPQTRWESRFDGIRAEADERAAAFDLIELTSETPLEPVPTDLPRLFLTRERVTFDRSPAAPRVFPADEGARESALPHPFTVEAFTVEGSASADLARFYMPSSPEQIMAGSGPPVLVYVEPRVPASLLLATLQVLGASARVVVRGPRGIGTVGFDAGCVDWSAPRGIVDWLPGLGVHVTPDQLQLTAYHAEYLPEVCASLRREGGHPVIDRDAAAYDLHRFRTCAREGEIADMHYLLVDATGDVDAQRLVGVLAALGGLRVRASLCDRQPASAEPVPD